MKGGTLASGLLCILSSLPHRLIVDLLVPQRDAR
jgi:hypothetical protein